MKSWSLLPLLFRRTPHGTAKPESEKQLPLSFEAPSGARSRLNATTVLTIALIAIFSTGCVTEGGPAETPTPTKTPAAQAEPPTATPIPPPPPTATPVPANLAPYTGLPLADHSLKNVTPIFVCLNNDTVSRASHFGLNEADITYEYIVDGFHLTRITSMYPERPRQRDRPSAQRPLAQHPHDLHV